MLKRHNIAFRESERPGNQDDHILISFGPDQTANAADFAAFYMDSLVLLYGRYQRDERVTAADIFNERRKVGMPAYVPFDADDIAPQDRIDAGRHASGDR